MSNEALEYEQIFLGLTLKYGKEAALIAMPFLTPDKFIFAASGSFGMEHKTIWKAIWDTWNRDGNNPSFAAVSPRLDESLRAYAFGLVDMLDTRYHIHQFDPAYYQTLMEQIDRQGLIFNVGINAATVASCVDSESAFLNAVNTVGDVEQWATDQLNKIRSPMSAQSVGYSHISDITARLRDKWERLYSGETQIVLPCGMPSLYDNMLFARGEMAVIHGLSGSGKSTLVFQANLGAAIELYRNNLPGCIAINSLEMTDEDLAQRMTSILAGVNVSGFRNRSISRAEVDSLLEWADFIDKLPIFVDDTNFMTTTAMQYRATGLHVSENGPVVQISSDYGELFRDENASEEQRVNDVFRNQFRLSREINASVVAISQSTHSKAESGKSYIAGPDGTRYSRGILQASDMLCELWNPIQIEKSGRTIILPDDTLLNTAQPFLLVQKYRGADVGVAIPLGWKPTTTTFFDMNLPQVPGQETIFEHLDLAVNKWKQVSSW